MRTIRHTIIALVSSLIVLCGFAAVPAHAATNVLDPVCATVTGAEVPTACTENNKTKDVNAGNKIYGANGILTKAIRLLSMVVGVAAVIVIIIGGFKYILANGDANSINSAKNTILYAVIGLIVSVLAQAIVLFVLKKL